MQVNLGFQMVRTLRRQMDQHLFSGLEGLHLGFIQLVVVIQIPTERPKASIATIDIILPHFLVIVVFLRFLQVAFYFQATPHSLVFLSSRFWWHPGQQLAKSMTAYTIVFARSQRTSTGYCFEVLYNYKGFMGNVKFERSQKGTASKLSQIGTRRLYMLLRLFWFITELIDFVHGMLCGRRVVSFQLNN